LLLDFLKERKDFEFPEPVELKLAMQDFLEDNPNSKYWLGEKGKAFVTREDMLKKKYTQINGDVALCQIKNQQFNWHGDLLWKYPKRK